MELGMDPFEDFGDVERGAYLLEYVEGHVNLRQTFTAGRFGWRGSVFPEATDGTQLGLQGGFKYGQYGFLKVVIHGGASSA
jgi:hypothetical protein